LPTEEGRCSSLKKRILVTSAWPYINYIPHLGTIIQSLSGDVIARYHRLRGDDVLYVSGSDEHGTPIEVEALRRGIPPKELTDRNHELVSDLFKRWEISFDNYTRTESPVHKEFVQRFLLKIYENGYVFTKEAELPYCPKCKRFLPDRFVEGVCPYCGYENARGDQCESCGQLLDPTKLINPHCTICNSIPEIRKTKHWYFDLPALAEKLEKYISTNDKLPSNAKNFSLKLIKEGLKARPITRDIKWGIPAPFPGAEDKTIYVWVEAVLGYVSATIEYFREREPERWRDFWFDGEAETLYFIGKDNIPFHTIILPALLMASHEEYNLPTNVSSTEFLNYEGKKFSKSMRVGVWIDEALELFPADYWRYVLLSIRPETKDANFTWEIFIEKVNADLNDALGNFIHRTITFLNNHFDSRVPEPKGLGRIDQETLQSIKEILSRIEEDFEALNIQMATRDTISLSRLGNQYLNEKAPWKTLRSNLQTTANTLYVALQIVKALAIAISPVMPKISEALLHLLNLKENFNQPLWEEAYKSLPAGHKVKKAKLLFRKIEKTPEEIEKKIELLRLRRELISFKEFQKMKLKIGKIINAEAVPKSKSLIKMSIDLGEGNVKTSVAGLLPYYKPEELVGKQVAVVTNLEPRTMFGVKSEVMVLAALEKEKVSLLIPDRPVKAGSEIS